MKTQQVKNLVIATLALTYSVISMAKQKCDMNPQLRDLAAVVEAVNPDYVSEAKPAGKKPFNGQCQFFVKGAEGDDFDESNYGPAGEGYVDSEKKYFIATNHQWIAREEIGGGLRRRVSVDQYKYGLVKCEENHFFVKYNKEHSREITSHFSVVDDGHDRASYEILMNRDGSSPVKNIIGFSGDIAFDTKQEAIGKYLIVRSDSKLVKCKIYHIENYLTVDAECDSEVEKVSGRPIFLADSKGDYFTDANGRVITIGLHSVSNGRHLSIELNGPILSELKQANAGETSNIR